MLREIFTGLTDINLLHYLFIIYFIIHYNCVIKRRIHEIR